MPGSCHWDEVEQVHGQAGCLDGQRLGVREGAAGARLLQEAEGENHCHLVPPGAVEKMDPDSSQRCKSQQGARVSKDKSQHRDSLRHGKF